MSLALGANKSFSSTGLNILEEGQSKELCGFEHSAHMPVNLGVLPIHAGQSQDITYPVEKLTVKSNSP